VWRDGKAYDVDIVDYHWGERMPKRDLPPIHPGEMLLEDFLLPMQTGSPEAPGVFITRIR